MGKVCNKLSKIVFLSNEASKVVCSSALAS
jgi:hypothetical protein